mgnify:CR=1 FL=1
MINFSQIYEGWKNNLFPAEEMKEHIRSVSSQRMSICEGCEYISSKFSSVRPDIHCTHCGCTLAAKTKCLSCSCPINKWTAEMTTRDEEEKLMEKVYGQEPINKENTPGQSN